MRREIVRAVCAALVMVCGFLMGSGEAKADGFERPKFVARPAQLKFAAPFPCDSCANCDCPAGACANGACALPGKIVNAAASAAGVVCENGSCRLSGSVSSSGGFAANGSCANGSCSSSGPAAGWYPGKVFGRRR